MHECGCSHFNLHQIPQWCPSGTYCRNVTLCRFMHPRQWSGHPKSYCYNFYEHVNAEDEIKVDPDQEPIWAIPRSRYEQGKTIDYYGCPEGTRCNLVFYGTCTKMHPATTESVAYVSAQANTIAETYPRAD